MANTQSISRRDVLQAAAAAALTAASASAAAAQPGGRAVTKGRLKQSVSRWCYQKIAMPEFCKAVAGMGLTAIDLLDPPDWQVAKEHGLICSMGYGGGGSIRDGLNNPANHDSIVNNLVATMPKAAAMGVPNLITFFGNRMGRSDADAIKNCVSALNRLKGPAEQHGITICVELLNSKVNHADYHGDRTPFGVEIVGAVNSPRVKLLYDIYHMQIMEGDVIRTIRDNIQYIAHFHTGGVPGRHELDGTQELNYHAIARALADAGYTGFVAHEFMPTATEPLTSLRAAVAICTV